MIQNNQPAPKNLGLLEDALFKAAKKASSLLEPRSLGILVRKPLLDEDCPEVSDVDLISIWEGPEEFPERITVESQMGQVYVDVLWIPVSKMVDSLEAASYKVLPHLLLEYEPVWLRSEPVRELIDSIKLSVYDKAVWERRIGHQIGFGDAALEESRKNLDFPPAALFFLQTAHSYYITALADCLKRSTMSLLTRPVTKLEHMAAETNCELESLLRANLHLDIDPSPSLVALRRVHNNVTLRCAGRQLLGVSMRAKGHFAYSISPLELEYRLLVANALVAKKDYPNANFYLRFWGYSVSRCPVVLEEAREGRKPSFYVPFEPFKKSVQATCPEILADMETILGKEVTTRGVEESINGTILFRKMVSDEIQDREISLEKK
jgi:hypothetical protein